jgi:ribonucleoside-diphosphate reductase alpha chain
MKFELSENALKVLEKRYLSKDETGRAIETPEGMFRRVAKAIASADKLYNKTEEELANLEESFYRIMAALEFMPNSPALMNAGKELAQLSACFTLPIDDSMDSIFETLKAVAMIHKSGGGTGFSFSRLRPKNSTVKTTGGIASGPVSFMKVYDAATEAVKQGGTRRGANMGILRVEHPDILEFITCKENNKEITNFNISVSVTDDFMQKLQNGESYDLIDPHTNKTVQRLNTKEIFDLIVRQAHKNGEPGVIFIDRINHVNPTPKLGQIESTNPCGEQPILPYESCDLGSINLAKMYKETGAGRYEIDGSTTLTINPEQTKCVERIDWDKLRTVTHLAVHFLDNLIDVNKFPLPAIEKATKLTRKIGLGVMGWASLLIRLNIPYNSDEAVALAEKVMSFILNEATIKSQELGKVKGLFPAFKGSIYDKKEGALRLRNATLTTIAPTGTISIIAGPCSSGIEPLFAISYYRNVMDNDKLTEVEPLFEEVARKRGFYSRELMQRIAERSSIQDFTDIPEDVKRVFVTSHDISPEWHVRMQAAFQKYTHNAVSKTINFPHQATVEDVRHAYMLAYELGCKGITIYRDRSREEQVLNIARQEQKQDAKTSEPKKEIAPRPRPEVINGTTTKVATGCGNLYVTINSDEEGRPFELFTQMGKAGGCAASQLEATGRLVSLAFRSGIEVKSIIEQLRNIRCPSPSWEKGQRIFSCADAIARVIEKRLMNGAAAPVSLESPASVAMKHSHSDEPVISDFDLHGEIVGVCPDCGGALRHEEGCVKCHACGFSKC